MTDSFSYRVPTKDYRAQYAPILPEVLAVLERVLTTEDPILGESVARFEEAFAALVGTKHAAGTGSGTDAITLALRALGVGPGDEVITAANTFVGTVTAIALAGAMPVLADPDPVTMNLDPASVARALTARTRALLPVHLYGRICPIAPFRELAKSHDLVLVEDAAQAHGVRDVDGRRAGSLGDAAAFSFHPSKNLGAFGDGGIVTTDDAGVRDRLERLRHLGKRTKYEVEGITPNTKLDTLQAALLLLKLPALLRGNDRRRALAGRYRAALAEVGDLILPDDPPAEQHVYHLFVVRTASRDRLRLALRSDGINTGIQYPKPPHLQDLGLPWRYRAGDFPVAEACARTVLSLPISPELTDSQIDHVADRIRNFFGR